MDVIQLQPNSVVSLTLLALIVPFALYLITFRDKDEATWWLIVYLAASALMLIAYGIFVSVFWVVFYGSGDPSAPERAFIRLVHLFGVVAAWAYVQFAYKVLRSSFYREARLVGSALALFVLGYLAVLVYNFVAAERLNFWTASGTMSLYGSSVGSTGLYLWALVVFLRKRRLFRRTLEKDGRRLTEALGVYAVLTVAAVVSTAIPSGIQIGLDMPDVSPYFGPLLGIVVTFGLAFAFVNYTPRTTTFQVKLVGLTLAAVLLVLASAVVITAKSVEADLQGQPIHSGQAFRFTPDEDGGYEVGATAIGYDHELGEDLTLGNNDAEALALPFDFPFSGALWDTVYIYDNGIVTFGGLVDTTQHRHRDIHRNDLPRIAPLYLNLNPARGGGVFGRVDRDRLVVSWHDVPHWYGWKDYTVSWFEEPVDYEAFTTRNRVQLVLHADGVIDMVYDRVEIPPGLRTSNGRGLVMGRSPSDRATSEQDLGAVFREPLYVDFNNDLAFTVPPGRSILEDLYVTRRRALHGILLPLVWLIIGSTLFVVFFVPYFHRWSLSKPLDRLLSGMKRVDGGHLQVEVPVGVRDEIGVLTHHFNQMTGSLREADAELRAYAEHLEERVDERTAELSAEKDRTEAQAERLRELDEAKSRFFANVSHELRTPLTLLLGPIRDALSVPELGLPSHQLPAMHRSAERLLSLVDELLDLARLDAGRLCLRVYEQDLVALTRRTVLAFASRAERDGLALLFDTDRDRVDAWVDAERYERIVSNLLTNAFKFTPSGGRVRVTLQKDGATAVLSVRDTGEGIREDLLPHVFERFRQGDDAATRRHEGAGIGLALVRELTDLHGGDVAVESEVGFGSAFTVRLPLGKEHFDAETLAGGGTDELPENATAGDAEDVVQEMPDAVVETFEEDPSHAVRTDAIILIVEDHDDMRAYLRDLLSPHYHVEEAADGEAGLETARRLAAEFRTPELIISDVMMPGMDGYALCHALKEDDALGHVPVVLLTARADEESRLEGLGEGADDYLAKPFSAEELLARCENLIEVRRRLRARFSGEVVVKPTDIVVERDEADWLDEVKAICDERLSDPNFGVDWLADELEISARTLRRRMKAASGLTPGAFMRTLRLERAAQLLEQGASVAEVATSVGYTEAVSFSRAFRQGFGEPPSMYAEREE